MQKHSERQLGGIEVLRFICAFGVLIWHYQQFFFISSYDNEVAAAIRSKLPFYSLLSYAYGHGHVFVQLFWVISGFVFYYTYSESISVHEISFRNFILRRFSRLYPLHFITLILVAILQLVYAQGHDGSYFINPAEGGAAFVSQVFMASNWFAWQTVTYNGSIWTVSVEILTYLAFFVVVRRCGQKSMFAIALAGVALLVMHSRLNNIIFYDGVFECAALFFAGGAACQLSKERAPIALTIALCAFLCDALLLKFGLIGMKMAIAIVVGPILVAVAANTKKLGALLQPLEFLGNATYSSYLIHFPIQIAIVTLTDAMGVGRALFLSPIAFLGYLATVMLLALAIYHKFEMPAQNWIRVAIGRPRNSSRIPRES